MVRLQWALTTTLWMAEVVSASSIHNYQNSRPRARRRARMVDTAGAHDPNDDWRQPSVPLWKDEASSSQAQRNPVREDGNDEVPDVGILSLVGHHQHRHLEEEDEASCDYLYGCALFNCNRQAYQTDMGCDFSGFDNVTQTGIITGCSYMFCKHCEASDDPDCAFCSLYSFKVGCGSGGSYTIEYQGELACATWPNVCASTYTGSIYFPNGIQNETDVPTWIKTNIDNMGDCTVDVLGVACADNPDDPAAIFTCPGGSFRAQIDSCDQEFSGFPFRPTMCSEPRALSNITGKQICAFKSDVQASSSTVIPMWSVLAVMTSSMLLLWS